MRCAKCDSEAHALQVAVARLRRLPVLHDFPIDAVPRSPYPNDSELYCAIR